ncbi:cipC protein [Mucidula mucida]|nr:cipC protein [Mucidula mucida]KAF8896963.1 cipC protein [Mucidula mucida]
MILFSDDSKQAEGYDQVLHASASAKLSPNILAAAAEYEASNAYDTYCKTIGIPDHHSDAMELVIGVSNDFIDDTVKTKGLEALDKDEVHRMVERELETALYDTGYY